MVLDLRWCVRLGAIAGTLAAASALSAQAPASTLAASQENIAKRTSEWRTLATNLEQRVARLLPCDARVRSSIEEVSRASEARTVALTTYWTLFSTKSKGQIEAIQGLLTQEEGRSSNWAADRSDAQVDVAVTSAQSASLGASIRQIPALATPQKQLDTITQMYRDLEKQAQEREAWGSQIVTSLTDLLKASQARQSAIDARMKAVSDEGLRWSAYYEARQTRAQIECSLTNPSATIERPPQPTGPRPVPQGKKQ